MADITALIARLEAATEPSRELDVAIQVAVHGGRVWEKDAHCFVSSDGIPRFAALYTASLDAALTLVPEGGIWHTMNDYGLPGRARVGPFNASFYIDADQPKFITSDGATPALALCIATLKARMHMTVPPMVERVARAICCEGECMFLGSGRTCCWSVYSMNARAAIGGMKEPTEGMRQAAYAAWENVPIMRPQDAVSIYEAMIDAALTEKPE